MDIFTNKIKPLFDNSGLTDAELEKQIGLPKGKIYDWKSGRNKSYKNYVDKIAAYFNVSADYLLSTKNKPTNYGELTDEQKIWIKFFEGLSPEKLFLRGYWKRRYKKIKPPKELLIIYSKPYLFVFSQNLQWHQMYFVLIPLF